MQNICAVSQPSEISATEEIRDLFDCEDCYGHEINQLFDLSVLSVEGRNKAYLLKTMCWAHFLNLMKTAQDYDDIFYTIRSKTADFFASFIPENLVHRIMKEKFGDISFVFEKWVFIEKNIIEEEAEEIRKRASYKQKGCLNYIVNGDLEQRIEQNLTIIFNAK